MSPCVLIIGTSPPKAYSTRTAGSAIIHPAPSRNGTLNYKKSGFDALVPTSRSDCGLSRKIDAALEEIRYLKTNYPRLSAAEIFRQLRDKGSIRSGQLSESTVLRFINQMMLSDRLTTNQDLRRYERPHINEVWCGDSSVGPYLKTDDGKKTPRLCHRPDR